MLRQLSNLIGARFKGSYAPTADGWGPAVKQLEARYDAEVAEFYAYLPDDVRNIFVADAIYHKARYVEMLARPYGPRVLELGSDKPFISHYLRLLHQGSAFDTISIDIPFSKHPIVRVDIEGERFPFEDETFSDVIFTEVLEHLFRDPSWTAYQMNRVMQAGGVLFLTTPNACGYDCLINLLNQANPNARSQFYAAMESGHPHLWTGAECRLLLEAHGFEIVSLDTADYVPIPKPPEISAFLTSYAKDSSMHGQSLRVVARKVAIAKGPVYPAELFPESKPVQLQGATLEWATRLLRPQQA